MSIETIDPRIAADIRDGLVDYDPNAEDRAAQGIALGLIIGVASWAGFAAGMILGHWVWVR